MQTTKNSTILLIHTTCEGRTTGDRIRVEKIQHLLCEANLRVFNVKIPLSYNRNELLTAEYLEKILHYSLPFNKRNLSLSFSASDFEYLLFNTSVNYLSKVVKQAKPDILLAEGTKAGWVASVVSKKFSVCCIIDMHGIAFAEARGFNQKNWLKIFQLEAEAFRNCDYLIAVSNRMSDYVKKKMNVLDRKVIVAPNGSELQSSLASYCKPLKIIYAGGFSYWENVNDYLDTAKCSDQKRFRFYIAGDRSVGQTYFKRIEKENIPITYLGYTQRPQVLKILSQMQVGIAPSTDDLARQVACPVKVFDYMAAGLPVVTPHIGDWGDLVLNEKCGIALPENNVEQYVLALNRLYNKTEWVQKSENARKIIKEKYTWKRTLEPILELINNIIK